MTITEKLRQVLIERAFEYVDGGGVHLRCNECNGVSPRGSWREWHRAVEHQPGCKVGKVLAESEDK